MSDTVLITWAKDEKRCWNYYQTIYACIGCNCCARDKKLRYQSRLRVLKEMLQEQYDFNDWAPYPDLKALQERNTKANIRYFKRRIRYYEKKLAERSGK